MRERLSEADIQRAGIVARNELVKRSGDQQKEPARGLKRHEKAADERAR